METATPTIAVIGGGLAGLTAAAYAARGGASVTLFERSSGLGGRAATRETDGFFLNRGPHALYRGGAAEEVLGELGVPAPGLEGNATGAAWSQGKLYRLPAGAGSLLSTGLLGVREKVEAANFLRSLGRLDAAGLDHLTVDEWLSRDIRYRKVRLLLQTYLRVANYANAPSMASAGAMLRQLQFGRGGVIYVDHGWQTLVRGLTRAAEAAGATVRSDARVLAVEPEGGRHAVILAGGERMIADAVIVATPPVAAASLLPHAPAVRHWADAAIPIQAACLDLGLSHLPDPSVEFVLGVDVPLYFSLHTRAAKLAPAGGHVIHAAKYLDPAEPKDPERDRRQIERLMDAAQPGWRDHVVVTQFLPAMTVVGWTPLASGGGLAGRPGPAVPGLRGAFVAGDWVGQEGSLAHASFASGRDAARLALASVATMEAMSIAS